MSPSLKGAPSGIWFVYSPATFSDNPYPYNTDHCSMLITAGDVNAPGSTHGSILIDIESVSEFQGIYRSYSGQPWKKIL